MTNVKFDAATWPNSGYDAAIVQALGTNQREPTLRQQPVSPPTTFSRPSGELPPHNANVRATQPRLPAHAVSAASGASAAPTRSSTPSYLAPPCITLRFANPAEYYLGFFGTVCGAQSPQDAVLIFSISRRTLRSLVSVL